MNKMMKWGMASLLSLSLCSQAMAAFTISGTRFIYEEGKKNVSFEVTNQADETFGGQVWINNTTQNNGMVYMVPAPPFFKVRPKEKQIIRIMRTASVLPSDRESLFWLNVQEIPPKPKVSEGNVLAVAVNTKVKLIYRPKALVTGRHDAEKKMQIIHRGTETYLVNPTPYYFAVTGITVNGQPVKLSDTVMDKISQFAPKSEVALGHLSLNGTIMVQAVNDWGGMQKYTLE